MKALTFKNSTTSEFDYNDKGRYYAKCFEMECKIDAWLRAFVIDEHKKSVYFEEDKMGQQTYYIRHKKQYLPLESLVVGGGCEVNNRKWCFITPNP